MVIQTIKKHEIYLAKDLGGWCKIIFLDCN